MVIHTAVYLTEPWTKLSWRCAIGLEVATYISDLVVTNPVSSDLASTGDDHLRLIKSAIKTTFPNISGEVTPTHTELNYVDGVTSAIQTQLDTKLDLVSIPAAVKAAHTLRTSTTTLADDPDLTVALTSGTWAYELQIFWTDITTTTQQIKLAMVYSGTNILHVADTQTVNNSGVFSSTVNSSSSSLESGFIWVPQTADVTYTGIIRGTTTVTDSGNLKFQWAQGVSNANATRVNAGSRLIARKIS